jgi:hypothetical protein
MNRHAWLQKHPSPQATRGEFHWYPEALDAGHREHRELRAGFVERVRGVEPPAVLWRLEPGRVAWGQVFAAIAPLDGRRYIGLVLSVVEDDRPEADLLAMLLPPPAAPWTHESIGSGLRRASVASGDEGARPAAAGPVASKRGLRTASKRSAAAASPAAAAAPGRELGALAALPGATHGDVAGVVRALLTGGASKVEDPTSPDLPRWIASIERILPESAPKPRCGVWTAVGGPSADNSADGAGDRVAALAAAAWREPGSRAAQAWTLLCELAAVRRESVDQVGASLTSLDAARVLTAAERADLAGCDRVVDVLQAWGRGRLDRSATAGTLTARLAELVALRVLERLAAGDDAHGAIAEARWYALLPAPRRTALLAAVAQRTASLRALVEAHHA